MEPSGANSYAHAGTKFNVVHDSIEKLRRRQVTELPAQVAAYAFVPKEVFQSLAATFGLWFEEGVFDLKPDRFLNEAFPEIRTMKVKEMLEEAWKTS